METTYQPQEDDIFMEDCGPLGSMTSVSCDGEFLGEYISHHAAFCATKRWMRDHNYYPNVWFIDDHGGFQTVEV